MEQTKRVVQNVGFGVFEVDFHAGELRKHGVKLRLQEKPLAALQLMLEHAGEVVSHEMLQHQLWPDDTHVDFDHGIKIAINKLRTALGDTADNPRFIQTLPRRGYRFIAPVRRHQGQQVHSGKIMMAVLPFVDLHANPEQDYFADGLTEEVITQLGRVNPQRLGVIARTSAMRYKNAGKPVNEIAGELDVAYVLEGSVRRAGTRLRIAVQLIQADDQTHIWAESFDRNIKDLFAIQAEVAEFIARALVIELLHGSSTLSSHATTQNTAAYEYYFQGRYHWYRRTENDLLKAIEMFQKSIEADPNYALPYTGLSDSYAGLGYFGFLSPQEAYSKAKSAALKAMKLDDRLGETHSSLAFVSLQLDWDWATSERLHLRAVELGTNNASVHHWYGLDLTQVGRFRDAEMQLEQARLLDPLSVAIHANLGRLYYFMRDAGRAVDLLEKAVDLEPKFVPAHFFLGSAYVLQGKPTQAILLLKKTAELTRQHPAALAALIDAYVHTGELKAARNNLDKLRAMIKVRTVLPYFMASALSALGETDESLKFFKQAFMEGSAWLLYVKFDPIFDKLRSDSRFTALLKKVEKRCVGTMGRT